MSRSCVRSTARYRMIREARSGRPPHGSAPASGQASSMTYGPPPTESRDDISTKRPTRKGAVEKLPRADR